MTDITYSNDIPDDIAQAELEQQEINQGRLIARKWLLDPHNAARSNAYVNSSQDEYTMLCKAAIHSGNLERISDLERQVAELQGQLIASPSAIGLMQKFTEEKEKLESELEQSEISERNKDGTIQSLRIRNNELVHQVELLNGTIHCFKEVLTHFARE